MILILCSTPTAEEVGKILGSACKIKRPKNWGNRQVVLDEPNKDAALLPEKVGGNTLFHRRHPNIWIAYSKI